jgi:S-adenosylmethionine hydrolase
VVSFGVTARRIITLTTDFGLRDAYVAVMKGVILGIAPDIRIVDVSHDIRAQDTTGAAYVLDSAYRYFPPDSIHVAVVDPGVGTARRPVAIHSGHGTFVGPDNGIFSACLTGQQVMDPASGKLDGATAVMLNEERFQLTPVSQTFHGRDIFAPAAAHLACGLPLEELGPRVERLQTGEARPPVVKRGAVYGTIVHVDHFGNAISNLSVDLVPATPVIEVAGRTLKGLATSYQDARVIAIIGSTGLLEIAARNASAAETLGLRPGDPVVVRSER